MSEPLPDPRPKPRFSLTVSRERLIELGVVVFGVMIALGLDNLVQEVRLRGDARELEKAFRADIIEAVSNSWERQLVDPCQRQTLASLTERANSSEGGWEAAPDVGGLSLTLPAPYRTPTRLWTTASFDRALGTEAFKRIPLERADAYAVLFAQIATRREENAAEFQALSSLAPLAFTQTGVDAEVRAGLLQSLSEIDRQRGLAVLVSEQLIAHAFSLPGGDDIRAEFLRNRSAFEAEADQRGAIYGECIDRGATERLMRLAAAS